ncbi:MAG: hypothetical protein J5702_05260 [Bacteroidales bacterium]|nr:hypothetical protein [Bacteroidales bacterium]
MKKLTSLFVCLILGVVPVFAQNAFLGGHRAWTFALEGGPMYSINENGFSYRENGYGMKLFSLQGSFAVGYEFTNALGARVSVNYGDNRSAANTRQTAAHGFYPYNFRNVNGFADITLDLNGNYLIQRAFRPVFYLGVGVGHTYHFTKPTAYGTPKNNSWEADNPFHPWQDICENNTVFGFRGGFIAEYDFTQSFGIFADLCGEAFNDQYNGLQPSEHDQTAYTGYAGFPLDLRVSLSLGVIFRINY